MARNFSLVDDDAATKASSWEGEGDGEGADNVDPNDTLEAVNDQNEKKKKGGCDQHGFQVEVDYSDNAAIAAVETELDAVLKECLKLEAPVGVVRVDRVVRLGEGEGRRAERGVGKGEGGRRVEQPAGGVRQKVERRRREKWKSEALEQSDKGGSPGLTKSGEAVLVPRGEVKGVTAGLEGIYGRMSIGDEELRGPPPPTESRRSSSEKKRRSRSGSPDCSPKRSPETSPDKIPMILDARGPPWSQSVHAPDRKLEWFVPRNWTAFSETQNPATGSPSSKSVRFGAASPSIAPRNSPTLRLAAQQLLHSHSPSPKRSILIPPSSVEGASPQSRRILDDDFTFRREDEDELDYHDEEADYDPDERDDPDAAQRQTAAWQGVAFRGVPEPDVWVRDFSPTWMGSTASSRSRSNSRSNSKSRSRSRSPRSRTFSPKRQYKRAQRRLKRLAQRLARRSELPDSPSHVPKPAFPKLPPKKLYVGSHDDPVSDCTLSTIKAAKAYGFSSEEVEALSPSAKFDFCVETYNKKTEAISDFKRKYQLKSGFLKARGLVDTKGVRMERSKLVKVQNDADKYVLTTKERVEDMQKKWELRQRERRGAEVDRLLLGVGGRGRGGDGEELKEEVDEEDDSFEEEKRQEAQARNLAKVFSRHLVEDSGWTVSERKARNIWAKETGATDREALEREIEINAGLRNWAAERRGWREVDPGKGSMVHGGVRVVGRLGKADGEEGGAEGGVGEEGDERRGGGVSTAGSVTGPVDGGGRGSRGASAAQSRVRFVDDSGVAPSIPLTTLSMQDIKSRLDAATVHCVGGSGIASVATSCAPQLGALAVSCSDLPTEGTDLRQLELGKSSAIARVGVSGSRKTWFFLDGPASPDRGGSGPASPPDSARSGTTISARSARSAHCHCAPAGDKKTAERCPKFLTERFQTTTVEEVMSAEPSPKFLTERFQTTTVEEVMSRIDDDFKQFTAQKEKWGKRTEWGRLRAQLAGLQEDRRLVGTTASPGAGGEAGYSTGGDVPAGFGRVVAGVGAGRAAGARERLAAGAGTVAEEEDGEVSC